MSQLVPNREPLEDLMKEIDAVVAEQCARGAARPGRVHPDDLAEQARFLRLRSRRDELMDEVDFIDEECRAITEGHSAVADASSSRHGIAEIDA